MTKVFPTTLVGYQRPAEILACLFDNAVNRKHLLSPDKQWIVVLESRQFESLNDIAVPEVRLAGLKIDTRNSSRSRQVYFSNIIVRRLDSLTDETLNDLPKPLKIHNVSFSPNGQFLTFQQVWNDRVEVWVLDFHSFRAKRLTTRAVNPLLTSAYFWLPDNRSFLVVVATNNGKTPPTAPTETLAPVIFQGEGKSAINKAKQELLKSRQDELIFEFYALSELILGNVDGQEKIISSPAIFPLISTSPDGKHILLETFSYPLAKHTTHENFGRRVELIDIETSKRITLAELPVKEVTTTNGSAASPGPRDHQWRSDKPATVCWVNAADEGKPEIDAPVRDEVFVLDAPFNSAPRRILSLPLRFGGVMWGNDKHAVAFDWWLSDRKLNLYRFTPSSDNEKTLLFSRSFDDIYSDPGRPLLMQNEFGKPVLLINDNDEIFLSGPGHSATGDHPTLKCLSLNDGTMRLLWTCADNCLETPIGLLDDKGDDVLISRESPDEPPSLYRLRSNTRSCVVQSNDPYPLLRSIQHVSLKFKRADGVDMSADLFLPPGFVAGDASLPTLFWAYPNDVRDRSNSGKVKGSSNEFRQLNWDSVHGLALEGYAVLRVSAFPIVAKDGKHANDTFLEQLAMNAEAAISCSVQLGYVDRNRVAIGGHSYGAFMAANLATHTNLFKCAIARSGSYNRTLTPFGFQNEERTFWEAREMYSALSPFNYADKMKIPMLLIHGQADDNPGTFPMQSERYFDAIRGNGGKARLVLLPFEGHHYTAKESILHMLYEMKAFLQQL